MFISTCRGKQSLNSLRDADAVQLQDLLPLRRGQTRVEFGEGGVRPAEADFVRAVAEAQARAQTRSARRHVVLLDNRVVLDEVLEDEREEVDRGAFGLV